MREPHRLSRAEYVAGVRAGNRAVLAQAITVTESSRPEDAELAADVLEDCLPYTGNSIRVGITGVPGAGKSSVIEALGLHITRQCGETVAVIAVDPSSQLSGGSILGDKTRMQALGSEMHAFIRPTPSGATAGGVARHTQETILLCEAAGYRNILVETVGVGQSETAVHSAVDFLLLLMLTGAGDELQAMKRGVLELADFVAVNKADGRNKEASEALRREYADEWGMKAVVCSARSGEGIAGIWDLISERKRAAQADSSFGKRRAAQSANRMHQLVAYGLQEQFQSQRQIREQLPQLERNVLEGRLSPFRAAAQLLQSYKETRDQTGLAHKRR